MGSCTVLLVLVYKGLDLARHMAIPGLAARVCLVAVHTLRLGLEVQAWKGVGSPHLVRTALPCLAREDTSDFVHATRRPGAWEGMAMPVREVLRCSASAALEARVPEARRGLAAAVRRRCCAQTQARRYRDVARTLA